MRVRLAGCQKTDYLRADYIAAHASATYTKAGSSPHGSVDVCGSISGVNLTIKRHSDTWGSERENINSTRHAYYALSPYIPLEVVTRGDRSIDIGSPVSKEEARCGGVEKAVPDRRKGGWDKWTAMPWNWLIQRETKRRVKGDPWFPIRWICTSIESAGGPYYPTLKK